MRRRLWSFGVAATLALGFGVFQMAEVPVEGQSETTAWGHPNLEGIWLDVYDTPFERDSALGDREFATDEERQTRDEARMVNPGRNERSNAAARDVAGAYNAVFTSARPAGPRTSLVVDPPNGRIPPLTVEAEQWAEVQREWRLMLLQNTETCEKNAPGCRGGTYGLPSPRRFDVTPFYNTSRMNRHFGPEDQSLGDRCMRGTTPDTRGHRRIVQGEDSIAIGIDTGQGQGYQRIVNLGGEHPPSHVRLRHGDSRGHWEGETLVIETTNFSPKFPFRGSTENLRLTERYTRVDADTLEYEATIEDPAVWTAPWTIRQELKRQDDQQNRIYYEPRCHEGNYGLPALLIGARMDDQRFEEGTGPDPFSLDTATCVSGLADEGL
ncbi:MAG: hypothetical protein F4Y45_17045 [Acidobacteria bacterium]|nr:hypothetical protein [Acidobacteriota bacterium]MYD71468.1 hypothetical protein [Acidobacteriota bacterium]MYJ05052.1 hypothetical protein [Acidobacteriota bacterium]